MGKRPWLFGFVLLAGALVLVLGLLRDPELRRQLWRLSHGGRPLLVLRAPDGSAMLPVGDVEVLVGVSNEERVRPETFRCLLNNRDVTGQLTLGTNGAGGHLYGLVEGENHLRVEVFGQGWWPGQYLEDAQEVIVRVMERPNLDRA